ncbi:hypothetical protein M9H77_11534 [Catharanthus roseus]|uniref:Uncharacterized protein n=1 Tax=Catharanthus roseus TaxID=4058 RepID=A0ACC0BEW7_CATRO|nr:hypothetical protein M9H77_11534 [Catharanthus roseus]
MFQFDKFEKSKERRLIHGSQTVSPHGLSPLKTSCPGIHPMHSFRSCTLCRLTSHRLHKRYIEHKENLDEEKEIEIVTNLVGGNEGSLGIGKNLHSGRVLGFESLFSGPSGEVEHGEGSWASRVGVSALVGLKLDLENLLGFARLASGKDAIVFPFESRIADHLFDEMVWFLKLPTLLKLKSSIPFPNVGGPFKPLATSITRRKGQGFSGYAVN